ncbi:MAG: ABC transporter substrate-binding protein [Spirochaetaceae bacterium]|jgi:NitT/TauT family transport system substrate-binding protein|nr:ABC transporter substrate-binding protein [Spirochaetaceae bacterium]
MKKLFFVFLCCVTALGLYAKGQTEAVSEDDYVLKIAYGTPAGLCSAPLFIAEDKGFYKEEGLKFEAVRIDSSQVPQLLTSGTVDVASTLITSLILPLANGLDVKIPLAVHTGCIKALAAPASDIRTPADLKGKRIGVGGMGATPTIIIQRYLAELGISTVAPDIEVTWVIFPTTELPLALERGQVDAIGINDPVALILENSGKGRVIINTTSDPEMKDEFCCVLVSGSKAAEAHPEALAKMTRAIQKACRWVRENPGETARILEEKKYVAGDPKVNAEVLSTYNWNSSVSAARVALSNNLGDLQKIGLVPPGANVEAIVNNTFLSLPGVPDKL